MVSVRETLSESYPAVRESVPTVRQALTDFAARAADVRGEKLDEVRTAVSEAVTNAVVHAYRDGPGEIHITAMVAAGELWVLIADDGCGYRTPAEQPGLGWGLALIAQSSDEFVVAERAEGGTEVRIRFAIGATAAAGR